MCAKPEIVCENLLNYIIASLAKKQKESPEFNLPNYVLIRLCQMCGFIALKHLEFMDDTVYKELKRRGNVREERKRGNDEGKSKKKKRPGRKSLAANTASEAGLINSTMVSTFFKRYC